MDFRECIKKRIVRETKQDLNKTDSFLEIINNKIKSADFLPYKLHYSKITLLYDAMRMILEILALQKGYKVYNHECYTAFLKEIMGLSEKGDMYDKLRKVRNNINYYGEAISVEESKTIISDTKELIEFFMVLLENK
ncbi:MAG: hypothetical protein ACQESF_02145 [Nanobdellota archaeon]